MQVVWFKRDLRISDHEPLARATQSGPTLCLYVYEPELLRSPEYHSSHHRFINQSLQELDDRLQALGGRLTYRVGQMPEVLDKLHVELPIESLWSHEEVGNRITFDRDRRVAAWARKHGVTWHEIPQSGVVRRLKSRDGWSRRRDAFMKRPQASLPKEIRTPEEIPSGRLQSCGDLDLALSAKTDLQPGGEIAANQTLGSFLNQRGEHYSKEMSSPRTAWDGCSRLSTYLAWGCLSMKQVVQRVQHIQAELRDRKRTKIDTGGWLMSLKAYEARLSWHCHFMQKLEDEPAIEFENMNRAYDGLREEEFSQSLFDAWSHGRTGYPLVDACMRALHQHSWINFRMRAMLVSFASYHLWLHWRPTAVYLAQHFLDFEPGIHFSQFQMQSGTTGINTVRIYSPIKQVKDQDPEGEFIGRFVPELQTVPKEFIAEPHKMPLSMQSLVGCRIGKDYPKPIVEHATAYKEAKRRIFEVRGRQDTKTKAKRVFRKHGSRKGPTTRRRPT